MRRAYYDDTGTITVVVPERLAPNNSNPYIQIDNTLNVNEYRINTLSGTLEKLPQELRPQVLRRGPQI
jgi:hypothetical protein